jgi:hypothetical protein
MKPLRSRVRRATFLAIAITLLPGCSLLPGSEKVETAIKATIDTGVSDRKSYNDEEARLLLLLPCDISVGAYYRLTNAVQQEALTMLCSGRRIGDDVPSLGDLGS